MRRVMAVIGGILLALILSQFPEYAQQYVQRLGGAVDELRIITNDFDSAATEAGLTRAEALARYGATPDTFIQGRGQSMERTFARYQMLSATLDAITGATGWQRAAMLPNYLDPDISRRTLAAFQPAIPMTPEGTMYALGGFLIGYGIVSAILRLLLLPFRRRRRRVLVATADGS